MTLLQAGVDTTVIALWLGHADVRSTNAYLHADIAIKERALARVAPIGTPTTRYQPSDQLLAFLEACDYAEQAAPPSLQRSTPAGLGGPVDSGHLIVDLSRCLWCL